MCKTTIPGCSECGLTPLLRETCPTCSHKWRGATCEACGRPLAYAGRGRPPVYCQPEPGKRWSDCSEAVATYQRLMVLVSKVKARGGRLKFADPTWLMILRNQVRDYSDQPRVPAGQKWAGSYVSKNGVSQESS